MPSSILYTAQVPAFDRETGQLALASHHLLSAPTSIVDAFGPSTTLLLDPPPPEPYQKKSSSEIAATVTDQTGEGGRRRKRRCVPDETSSPADWIRHREREEDRTTTDRESDAHHAEITTLLQSAIEAVQTGWRAVSGGGAVEWLGGQWGYEWRQQHDADETRSELDLVSLVAKDSLAPLDGPLLLPKTFSLPSSSLAGRIAINNNDSEAVGLSLTSAELEPMATLSIPPSSGFLLSDMSTWSDTSSGIAQLGRERGGWDVLLIDPPWPNVSATRSSSYETFDPYDLWKLDVPALLGDKPAIVAVWLTNRVKFRRLVRDKLFPAWNVKDTAEWYWVKIASETGEPVWPLVAKHRRCYEGLLVGHYVPPTAAKVSRPSIPDGKVFLSTPIGHSRKPYILELLRPYLVEPSPPPNVLELFARMTLAGPFSSLPASTDSPGVTDGAAAKANRLEPLRKRGFFLAVGNEAIKFNVVDKPGTGGVRGWIRDAPVAGQEIHEP
ncbi:hypothetical protein JCM10908_003811 [Rhodotorula pacifica]|uniref:uncharacterized protein n=1 Tax=Rhodotorula pacifica TaxID=1495444 RepID=UPI0031804027